MYLILWCFQNFEWADRAGYTSYYMSGPTGLDTLRISLYVQSRSYLCVPSHKLVIYLCYLKIIYCIINAEQTLDDAHYTISDISLAMVWSFHVLIFKKDDNFKSKHDLGQDKFLRI